MADMSGKRGSARVAFLAWGVVVVPAVSWYVGVIASGRPLALILALLLPAAITGLAGLVLRQPARDVVTVSLLSSGLVLLGLVLALIAGSAGGGFDTAG